jgi:hypothetical protein
MTKSGAFFAFAAVSATNILLFLRPLLQKVELLQEQNLHRVRMTAQGQEQEFKRPRPFGNRTATAAPRSSAARAGPLRAPPAAPRSASRSPDRRRRNSLSPSPIGTVRNGRKSIPGQRYFLAIRVATCFFAFPDSPSACCSTGLATGAARFIAVRKSSSVAWA